MDYVSDFTVRAGIWDDATRVAEVKCKRHTVIFPENADEPSKITYCNNCGHSFILQPDTDRSLPDICANCYMEQERHPLTNKS